MKSRLPRRSGQHPSVSELVKRYQEFLPASLSEELAISAFPPPTPSLSLDSDSEAPPVLRLPRPRNRVKSRVPQRKESMSDFEHSYAANVVPRHLGNPGTSGRKGTTRKVSGLPQSSTDSRESSRRTSPDKRPSLSKQDTEATLRAGRMSPTPGGRIPSGLVTPAKGTKLRIPSRSILKDPVTSPRLPSGTAPRLGSRRVSNVVPVGSKVSNMTRHFERLRRDTEKSQRRYAVIRGGRRARPVANTHATATVLDSIKDAIKDETYDSTSSSEADDEDDGEEDVRSPKDSPQEHNSSSSSNVQRPSNTLGTDHAIDGSVPSVELTNTESKTVAIPLATPPIHPQEPNVPSSITSPITTPQTPLETPPASDAEAGPSTIERQSTILRALSGIWPQQHGVGRGMLDIEGDDPMADPEHIFRESSMVVRTDEPTSIIALALKYVQQERVPPSY